MSQKNDTLILLLSLVITAGIIGGGVWWFSRNSTNNFHNLDSATTKQTNNNNSFSPPNNVAPGTSLKIDGSTSMVLINQVLKNSFEQQFPGTNIITNAGGSNRGIQDLLAGNVDLAAISRPLNSEEKSQGLVAVSVAKDAIAIVVGNNNPFRRGLTQDLVEQIFQGKINNWSALGSISKPIKVINRPSNSGTHQVFQEIVLNQGNFGTTPNIITMERDATTPILQALGTDGISYATYSQVANQQTVRTVAIDGLTPEAANYPYQRNLYYVYKEPASIEVQAFLGYTLSPLGQQIVGNAK